MKLLKTSIIYENPLPILKSIQSFFPSLCELDNGEILASHQLGEAFEAVNCTSFISRSETGGASFSAPMQMFDKKNEKPVRSDGCKITKLDDGRIVAIGYQFIRKDETLPLGNPETGGLLDDEVFYSISKDNGYTWSKRRIIRCIWGQHVEASAPITVLKDGSWATPITGFKNWEGRSSIPCNGRLLRSYDEGKKWNDGVVCMNFNNSDITCFEQRMCQLENGNIVVIGWNENVSTGELLNNHYTISTDNGKTFSEPIDTGIKGQASSILHIGGNKILAFHSLRRDCKKPGILCCLVDLSYGTWNILEQKLIWSPNMPIVKDSSMAAVFGFLKFGQPSGILLKNGKVLMTHWACENNQYKTYCSEIEL